MGLYTDPNYFEKQAHYQHRKVKKVIKAVSSKSKQPAPEEAVSEASTQVDPESASRDIHDHPVEPTVDEFDESPDLTQMTQEEYDAFMMGMTVEQYRVYRQMVLENEAKRNRRKQLNRKRPSPEVNLLLAALKPLCFALVICGVIWLSIESSGPLNESDMNDSPPAKTPNETVSSGGGRLVPLQPVSFRNGQIVTYPSGDQVAPLTVQTAGDSNFYIALKPIDGEAISNGAMSFLVSAKSAEVDVPLGTYEIYYAYGSDWYGKEYKFGENTEYFKCNEMFEFTADGEMVYGWTLTLYKVSNGNMSTDIVPKDSFPDI